MKKLTSIFALCLTVVVGAVLIFRAAYPEVRLFNLASTSYDELIVELSDSRMDFALISANSAESIYFYRQDHGGLVEYSLRTAGREVAHGRLAYDVDGRLFREIRLVICKAGVVSAVISG